MSQNDDSSTYEAEAKRLLAGIIEKSTHFAILCEKVSQKLKLCREFDSERFTR